jgi:hypothetical protein
MTMAMAGYTKLFSSIIHSTIWREADHIRIVWITMLAMADRDGVVESSVPGLADASRVTLGECREALAALMAPDPDSRTPDNEGRRIAPIDGGWELLNYNKYREKLSKEQKRAATAERVARHRKRKSVTSEQHVTPCNKCNAIAEAEAEADPKAEVDSESDKARAEPAAHTPKVDRFMASFAKPSEGAVELFEAWKLGASKPNSTLDAKRAGFFGRLALEGVTPEQVAECMRGAKLDPWARDTAKLSPSAVLGSAEQREKFIAIARDPPKTRITREPPQPNDENNRYVPRKFVLPETDP